MSKIVGITVGTTTNPKKITKGYVPENLTDIQVTTVLGGDWENSLFYVWDKTLNRAQKTTFKLMLSRVGAANIATNHFGEKSLSSTLDEIGAILDGVEELLSSI